MTASSSTTWAAISGCQGRLAPPGTPEDGKPLCFCQGAPEGHSHSVMWDFGQKPLGPVWSWPQEAWLHWRRPRPIVAVEMENIQ